MDPLGMTGSLCGSHCEPTGLSQYPVFKVQTAADSLHILRFCPPPAIRFVFGGKEIHYALASAVSTGFLEVFRLPFALLRDSDPGTKGASRMHLSGGEYTVRTAWRPGSDLSIRLPATLSFQHTLQSPGTTRGAVEYCTSRQPHAQELLRMFLVHTQIRHRRTADAS